MSGAGAPAHRAGLVALLGRPNAGKSTLLNALLREKLAIVTAKPQTTRSRILGILSRPNSQLLLLDTPGLHDSEKKFNALLNEQVAEAAADCDVAVLLVDLSSGGGAWEKTDEELVATLHARRTPVVVAGTKLDLEAARDVAPAPGPRGASAVVRLSARTGEGLEALLAELERHLPESPPLYPEDELSDRPLRFLAAELVREAAFESLSQELPYDLAVEVVEFDESRPDSVRIRADLIVARASQKGMVIGRAGAMIKRIGTRARPSIEALVGRAVHLELWVTVEPKWSKRPSRLRQLGYD